MVGRHFILRLMDLYSDACGTDAFGGTFFGENGLNYAV